MAASHPRLLAELLIEERRGRGLNQKDMARAIQDEQGGAWSQPKLSRIENGEQPKNTEDLERLARVVRVPVSELLGEQASDPNHFDVALVADLVDAAEWIRAKGDPLKAALMLEGTHRRIGRAFTASDATPQQRRSLARVSLGLALVQGDITPDRALRQRTLRHTRQALDVLDRPEFADDDLLFRALLRHGNELRKAGATLAAIRFLQRAERMVRGHDREMVVLVPLARAEAQHGSYADAEGTLRRLQSGIEDGLTWTAGFHDIAVLDTELRLTLLSPQRRLPVRHDLAKLIDRGGTLPERDGMAPQWQAIWAVSVCAYAIRRRQLDLAKQAAEQAMPSIVSRGLIRQQERLTAVLDAIEHRDTDTDVQHLRALSRSLLRPLSAPVRKP